MIFPDDISTDLDMSLDWMELGKTFLLCNDSDDDSDALFLILFWLPTSL